MTNEKLREGVGTLTAYVLTGFALGYLTSAFYCASFDISTWSPNQRMACIINMLIGAFAVFACVENYKRLNS